MNFRVIFIVASIACLMFLPAQADEGSDGFKHGDWSFSGQVTAAGSVNTYDNWQEGGSDYASISGNLELVAQYIKGPSDWKSVFKSEYGRSKPEGEFSRKTADMLSLDSIYNYRFCKAWGLYGRASVSSKYDTGYNYFDEPKDLVFDDDRPDLFGVERVDTSNAFNPINLELGFGESFKWQFNESGTMYLEVRTGLGARQLIESDYYREDDDSETEVIEYFQVEGYEDFGLDAGFDLQIPINEVAKFESKATGFYGLGDEFWKVTWDSGLIVSLTKYLGVSITNSMIYDEQIVDEAQWRTGTLLTINYKF